MSGANRYRRSDQVVLKPVGEEWVALDLATGDYYGFNNTAGRIWDLLEQENDQRAIVDRLFQEFAVPREQLAADCRVVLRQMTECGLVVTLA